MSRRSNPFASAVKVVRESARQARQAVDDGALDSTADGIEPVTAEEVEEACRTHLEGPRR